MKLSESNCWVVFAAVTETQEDLYYSVIGQLNISKKKPVNDRSHTLSMHINKINHTSNEKEEKVCTNAITEPYKIKIEEKRATRSLQKQEQERYNNISKTKQNNIDRYHIAPSLAAKLSTRARTVAPAGDPGAHAPCCQPTVPLDACLSAARLRFRMAMGQVMASRQSAIPPSVARTTM